MHVSKKGFTLLEILIAMSILVIVTSIVIGPFSSFRNRSILNTEVENVVTLLNEARSKTLTSLADSAYGVHFETNRAVFFKGDVFIESDPSNEEVVFNSIVQISNVSLNGGGSDVVFNRLTGKTDENGTLTIGLASDPTSNNIVYVYTTGSTEIK